MTDLRALPSVHAVAQALGPAGVSPLATHSIRELLSELREAVKAGSPLPEHAEIAELARERLRKVRRGPLGRVINATGVVLQTNLGRAPLSQNALSAIEETATGYANLEYDVQAGLRGSRHEHLRKLLTRTTGAEDAIVVNNNASALFMVLQVFAAGREVLVARGQSVEIGGGFRIPDVMAHSGATLVDVGTTNRTYTRDYETAVSDATAAILRVHTSNFRVVGFVAEPELRELSALAEHHGLLLIDDLGSGCLLDTAAYGMAHEPTIQESLDGGAGLSLFSGDKLLGGPQAGIIVGRTQLIERLRRHPLARALRVDKLTIAALAATLLSYAEGKAEQEIPVWRMISAPDDQVRGRAERLAAGLP
ncbi:MAG: L-seryl-tRNA(Sec) selenium transferase, partial [Dehalococcoidia bacterium]